ncbi:hypothetical protein [Anaeromassilibacillus senegalensis]|uniref:hypothetical protein n=1 Tax=Anaeromassilibacillus senegalensis TaxID=1673717 RepID=UPI00067FAB52|nr:hypothetical protein [Anaeromassilibacillus senegalensis]
METFTFAQNFALIALNAQDSLHMPTVKKIAVRCMAAAAILECYMDHGFVMQGEQLTFDRTHLNRSGLPQHQRAVLECILGKKASVQNTLPHFLEQVAHFSSRKLKTIERSFTDYLKAHDVLEEIPNLLGCDMNYVTAEVSMREYRSDESLYARLTEGLRAEILEDGAVTDEMLLMLWLLRESSCLFDLFSEEEVHQVASRMNEIYYENALAKQLFVVEIHNSWEFFAKNFLKAKKQTFTTPVGIGVNFSFPFLERSQSIFIDVEAWFEGKENRLHDVTARLEKYGHHYTILREGTVPLIKIDNILYEAVPTIFQSKVPVQGMRLRRYPQAILK